MRRKNGANIRVGLIALRNNLGKSLENALLVTKIFMLAALDSIDDIGARSLYTTLLDFAQDCKFDHDLTADVSE